MEYNSQDKILPNKHFQVQVKDQTIVQLTKQHYLHGTCDMKPCVKCINLVGSQFSIAHSI